MTESKPIRLFLGGVAAASADTNPQTVTLSGRFSAFAENLKARNTPIEPVSLNEVEAFLNVADSADAAFGADGAIGLADASEATDAALHAIASITEKLESTDTVGEHAAFVADLDATVIGVTMWAMRHAVTFRFIEPVANTLARRANAAQSKQETAAVFALMQGVIAHTEPILAADLERSNPERPWRIINLNFAITAIRSGDVSLMKFAFNQLNAALPDECSGFYEEAFTLASQPGFPAEPRQLIAEQVARHTRVH
jgi:hypothetical protein